jgi:Ni/Co efflux regulator RcnB
MIINLHPHARERLRERGATEAEAIATVESGEERPAKFGRSSFRRNFAYNDSWRGRQYAVKQVEAIAAPRGQDWLVITVITRFF